MMYIPVSFHNNPAASQTPRTILAGDIGGTKTNLALFHFTGKTFRVLHEKRYHTKDYENAGSLISSFLSRYDPPDAMSLGVAGPVQNGKVHITNVAWDMDSREISGQNGDLPVFLINDLEATGYGIAFLKSKDLHILYEPDLKADGNIALIAPGTGLGEAGMYWNGTSYYPFATEGGHCDFSPRSRLDAELYFFLRKRFGHVSWERVVSGQGIYAIYEFLHLHRNREIPQWLAEKMLLEDQAAVISANTGKAEICRETMELFLRYLATEAGNLALKMKATGGLFIGGGIITKILQLIDPDIFLENFRDFGRLQPLLREIPVKIILNEKTALLGAAAFGAFKH